MGANFRGKSERASKSIFAILNFVIVTSPGAWHCCTSDDVLNRYTCLQSSLFLSHTYRDLDE